MEAAAALRQAELAAGDLVRLDRPACIAYEKVEQRRRPPLFPRRSPARPVGTGGRPAAQRARPAGPLADPPGRPADRGPVRPRRPPFAASGRAAGLRQDPHRPLRLRRVGPPRGTQCRFAVVKPAEWLDPYVGVTEQNIRHTFQGLGEAAKEFGMAVIFLDEIEAIGRIRGSMTGHHSDRFLNVLLAEIDGFEGRGDVAILAATNLQGALRPGAVEPFRQRDPRAPARHARGRGKSSPSTFRPDAVQPQWRRRLGHARRADRSRRVPPLYAPNAENELSVHQVPRRQDPHRHRRRLDERADDRADIAGRPAGGLLARRRSRDRGVRVEDIDEAVAQVHRPAGHRALRRGIAPPISTCRKTSTWWPSRASAAPRPAPTVTLTIARLGDRIMDEPHKTSASWPNRETATRSPCRRSAGPTPNWATSSSAADGLGRTTQAASRLVLARNRGHLTHRSGPSPPWDTVATGRRQVRTHYGGGTRRLSPPLDDDRRMHERLAGLGAEVPRPATAAAHISTCTTSSCAVPEVHCAFDYVAAWHAMLRLARQALDRANARLADGHRIQVLVNNSDGLGNSYGSHLNFFLSRRAWNDIFHRKPHYLSCLAALPGLQHRDCRARQGGAENGAPEVAYQLSQRADFFEELTALQTTFARPLINTRDEPLCGGGIYDNVGPPRRFTAGPACTASSTTEPLPGR